MDKDRERIAKYFMVECKDCYHGENLANDCPHLDEDICEWQREMADRVLVDIKELGYHRIDLGKLRGLAPEEIGDCLDLEIEAKYPCSEGGSVWTVSVEKLLGRFLSSVKEQIKSQEGKE